MQVWRMNADGSEQTQMTIDESNSWFPHISPNGDSVAFLSYNKDDVAPGDHPANKHVEIRLMSSRRIAIYKRNHIDKFI
jgi:TolB protein